MVWKSIAGATGMGLLLVGPVKAVQKEPNLYEQAESAGFFEACLSVVSAISLADALKGR